MMQNEPAACSHDYTCIKDPESEKDEPCALSPTDTMHSTPTSHGESTKNELTACSRDNIEALEAMEKEKSELQQKLKIMERKCQQQQLRMQQQALEIRALRISQTKSKRGKRAIDHPPHSARSPVVISAKLQGQKGHSARFMAEVRYLKIACMLSNQKAAVALHLCHHILTGEPPCNNLGTAVSPATLSEWNVLLGEVDKAVLRKQLSTTEFDIAVFADDSNKRGEDRHMLGVHIWSAERGGPVGYLLANTIVKTGRGADQADTDYHVLKKVYGVNKICGVMGDNASTQSGARKGQAVELGKKFSVPTVFIGCYPRILNIALRNAMTDGFGQRGTMQDFNLFQLHFKVGYVHKQRPSFYKSLYVSEKITSVPPPLPQEFIETRWTYIHESLQWWAKYGNACQALGRRIVEKMPKSVNHFGIWEDILRMAANPVLDVERTMLLEVLDRLIMPSLAACQQPDNELQFSSGYLARQWPAKVMLDINIATLMRKHPSFAMPLTDTAKSEKLQKAAQDRLTDHVQKPFLSAITTSLEKHATCWLVFPLLFALGAHSQLRHLFWRAVFRVLGGVAMTYKQFFPAGPCHSHSRYVHSPSR
eukprot:scpid18064/ scgid32145/ 